MNSSNDHLSGRAEGPTGPLTGMTVIDMSTMMAGPHTAMLMADFGATVIKIEKPGEGDPSRGSPMRVEGPSIWWRVLGRNKYSVTLNLKHPEGRKLLLRLAETADGLTETMRPGRLQSLARAPATLHAVNRGLGILRITGWG